MPLNEHSLHESTVRAGSNITWAVSGAAAIYLAETPGGSGRLALAAFMLLASVLALLLRGRATRVAASPNFEAWITGWCTTNMLLTVGACLVDGGMASPLVGIFFLPVAYAAIALPRRLLFALSAIDVACVVFLSIVAGSGRHGWVGGLLWAALVMVTAAVCALLVDDRVERLKALQDSEYEVLRRMMRLVEYRDEDTGGHIERISSYSMMIGAQLGLGADACERLRWASTMHDVGKIAVPDAILLKPGPLTPAERSVMERHAEVGHEMLQGAQSDVLSLAATIALTHHERYDGGGYPQGLAGEAIPLEGRIVAVADVFDALTSERVYKRAMSVIEAVEIVRSGRGTQFDPQVVDAFLEILDELVRVHGEYGDSAADRPQIRALRLLSEA